MKIIVVLLLPALLFAQSSSEHFTLTKSVIDAGGGVASSANFTQVSAFGQPTPVGVQSSTNFVLYAGFLSPRLLVSPLSPIQRLVIKESMPDAVLNWEAITGASNYSIYRSTQINFVPSPTTLVGSTTATTYTDAGVLTGPEVQQYYIVLSNAP